MNLERLQSKLDRDFAYRKKEIFAHSQLLALSQDETQKKFLLRFGIVLLYSHWEGFLKLGVESLLEYYKNIPQKDVPPKILSAFTMGYFKKIEHNSKNPEKNKDIVDFFQKERSLQDISIKHCFDFESNINYDVFKKILFISCSEEPFPLKEKFINAEFVGIRHAIAHGEGRQISEEDFERVKEDILSILESFKGIIIDACMKNECSAPLN